MLTFSAFEHSCSRHGLQTTLPLLFLRQATTSVDRLLQ